MSGELISTTYVPGGKPFSWGTVNWPFSIVAPEAISLPPPVDVRRIDPSNGAPSKLTAAGDLKSVAFRAAADCRGTNQITNESLPITDILESRGPC